MTATDTVVVAGPDAPANGPEEPSAEAQNAKVSGRRATFDLVAYDDDGVPASYRVDWGDGTTASDGTFARNGCPEVGSRGYPRDTVSVPVSHDYARPGTYTVTITVTSTGCGGGDEQSGSVTWTAQVPLVGVPRQEP